MSTPSAPIPEGIDISTDGQGAVVSRRWYHPGIWFLVIFALVWDSFLFGWYSMATNLKIDNGIGLIFLVFPLGHVAVGLGLTYFVACAFVNVTDIYIRSDSLEVGTHPLAWFGDKTIPRRDIAGFLVRETTSSDSAPTYKLSYINPSNQEVGLISFFLNKEQTEYLCDYLCSFYQVPRKS